MRIIRKKIHEDITYDDIHESEDNLWNFLFFTGYMKKVSERQEKNDVYLTTAPTLTYTGSEQTLVTAGEATGGEMQYALGTATEATQPYTTSIPTATNAGT